MPTDFSSETTLGATSAVISVDAMGGDRGPSEVVAGIAAASIDFPQVRFIVHGPKAELDTLIAKHVRLAHCCEVRDAQGVVSMTDKPSHVMRHGKGTSMWSALEAVEHKQASVCVSCGNTGALMAVAMLRLRKVEGVNRPAIACLWPSRNAGGFNVMLDVGADIKADENDLLTYALMGTSYARNGLGLAKPRIGLLNVGTEEFKGRPELKLAYDLIAHAAPANNFEFVGFVEGSDIPSSRVDVIVTDGFTGNVALKTGEGTASLIREFLGESLRATLLSKLAAFLAMNSLKTLAKRIDPRRVNGGVFLGLNGTVVKSHGSADATGIAAAIRLAIKLGQSNFSDRLAARVASAGQSRQDTTRQETAGGATK
jgi:phosphate acyltransferase